jgi:hypothetical protein
MLLRLAQCLYWLTTIFVIALVVSAAALAFDIDRTDGFELYVVCTAMVAAALAIGPIGRAHYRMARLRKTIGLLKFSARRSMII